MGRIFGVDTPFYRAWSSATDLVLINLLTALFSLPLVTGGAALTAAARVAGEMAHERDTYVVRRWWTSFRSNLGQSFAWWLPLLILGAGGVSMTLILARADGEVSARVSQLSAMQGLLIAGVLLFLGVFSWFLPLVAFFDNTIAAHVSNAVRLAIGHLGRTALNLVVLAAPIALAVLLPGLRTGIAWFMVLLGISFLLYMQALIEGPVIAALLPQVADPVEEELEEV